MNALALARPAGDHAPPARDANHAAATPAVAHDLWVARGGSWVLRGVGLTLRAGTMTALRGPNGAGKSTLLRVLATLQRPDRGRVTLFGDATAADARRRIGYIGHAPLLYPALTARENLELFAGLAGVDAPRDRADAALARVGVAGAAGRPVAALSRGTAQRVAVARALIADPDLVLADEPTAGLDPEGRELVLGLLRGRATAGCAVLVAGHDADPALGADRELVLDSGRLVPGVPGGPGPRAASLGAAVTGVAP